MNNPFDMLKDLGKIQNQINSLKDEIKKISVEGSSGAGMVTVKMNGEYKVESLAISEQAYSLGDKATLELLIISAINDASSKILLSLEAKSAELAGGLGSFIK